MSRLSLRENVVCNPPTDSGNELFGKRKQRSREREEGEKLLLDVGNRGRKRSQGWRQPERDPVMFESEDVSE